MIGFTLASKTERSASARSSSFCRWLLVNFESSKKLMGLVIGVPEGRSLGFGGFGLYIACPNPMTIKIILRQND
jgi:hypothetical protein